MLHNGFGLLLLIGVERDEEIAREPDYWLVQPLYPITVQTVCLLWMDDFLFGEQTNSVQYSTVIDCGAKKVVIHTS